MISVLSSTSQYDLKFAMHNKSLNAVLIWMLVSLFKLEYLVHLNLQAFLIYFYVVLICK